MTSTAASDIQDEKNTFVIARITAQDVAYVEPLREFLHASGCVVEVNEQSALPATYWICVGDAPFVKRIIAHGVPLAQKRLCIVYEGDLSDGERATAGARIVYVDPIPLTPQSTRQVFSFLFTGRARFRNDRKGLGRTMEVSVIPTQVAREPSPAPMFTDAADVSRIRSIMKQVFASTESRNASKRHPSAMQSKKKIMAAIVGTVVALMLPVLIYGFAITLGGISLYAGSTSLAAGHTDWANRFLTASRRYTQSALTELEAGTIVFERFGIQRIAQDQESLLGLLADAAQSEIGVMQIMVGARKLAVHLLDPASEPDRVVGLADVFVLRSEVSLVSQHLALVQAQLDSLLASGRFPFTYYRVQRIGHQALEEVIVLRRMIEVTQRLLTLYPEIGGFKNPQTYLVLLQNSMELRPTGGFIGSLMLVTLTDGKMTDIGVQDVYVADGQLKGHVDPPNAIRNMLGSEHWYLRDSNWDPDFAKSALQAAWFYEKEMGTHVDGVVGISLPMVTRLLEVTGPLELTDFSERISASNFFVKSLLYTQTDFFPGSTQKKDFLGNLTTTLLLRLTEDKQIQAEKLLAAIVSSLDARDLQFYFTNHPIESVVTQWGWGGSVGFAPCASATRDSLCVGDGVGIVEANLGVNKVNYFMKQEATSHIRFVGDGTVTQDVTVTLNNTSNTQAQDGGGTYQAYIRVLYPDDTEFLDVSIDGESVPRMDPALRAASASASVVAEHINGVLSVGFPMFVPAKSEHQFILSTRRHLSNNFSPAGTYEYSIRKQAGVGTFPWQVTVEYPNEWGATSDVDLAKPGWLQYNTDLARDGLLKIFFDTSL